MKVLEAQKRIAEYQEYIQLYNDYQPSTLKQHTIKLYAELEHVSKVADDLNSRGFRVPGKKEGSKVKIISNDVTDLIDSKPDANDKLHFIVRKYLNKNRGKFRGGK